MDKLEKHVLDSFLAKKILNASSHLGMEEHKKREKKMSLDNGIYVLRSLSGKRDGGYEYRVAYATAIENIRHWPNHGEFNESQLHNYFGHSKVYTCRDDAFNFAQKEEVRIEDGGIPLEYGIVEIKMDSPFPKTQSEMVAERRVPFNLFDQQSPFAKAVSMPAVKSKMTLFPNDVVKLLQKAGYNIPDDAYVEIVTTRGDEKIQVEWENR